MTFNKNNYRFIAVNKLHFIFSHGKILCWSQDEVNETFISFIFRIIAALSLIIALSHNYFSLWDLYMNYLFFFSLIAWHGWITGNAFFLALKATVLSYCLYRDPIITGTILFGRHSGDYFATNVWKKKNKEKKLAALSYYLILFEMQFPIHSNIYSIRSHI